jgi:hypothetical protein
MFGGIYAKDVTVYVRHGPHFNDINIFRWIIHDADVIHKIYHHKVYGGVKSNTNS